VLGEIVDRLDDPDVAAGLLRDLEEPDLEVRLALVGDGELAAEVMAAIVRRFLETASDDHWVQLIGIMSRAQDPALEALRAILLKSLPGIAAALHA
jgi:hypothetical protein